MLHVNSEPIFQIDYKSQVKFKDSKKIPRCELTLSQKDLE